MTHTDVLGWLNGGWRQSKYVKTINGKVGLDTDGRYGHQCKDLVNAFADWLGHSVKAGDAKTLWTFSQDPFWQKVTSPMLGDVAVWKPAASNGDAGHTGVVKSVSANAFVSLDQNWYNSNTTVGSPPAEVTHNFGSLYGFLRPQLGGSMPTISQAELDDFRTWKAKGRELERDRDERLYPWIEKLKAEVAQNTAYIQLLKTERDTKLYPAVEELKTLKAKVESEKSIQEKLDEILAEVRD